MLPYGLDSNVTKLLANLIPGVYFIIFQIVLCNFVSIQMIVIVVSLGNSRDAVAWISVGRRLAGVGGHGRLHTLSSWQLQRIPSATGHRALAHAYQVTELNMCKKMKSVIL